MPAQRGALDESVLRSCVTWHWNRAVPLVGATIEVDELLAGEGVGLTVGTRIHTQLSRQHCVAACACKFTCEHHDDGRGDVQLRVVHQERSGQVLVERDALAVVLGQSGPGTSDKCICVQAFVSWKRVLRPENDRSARVSLVGLASDDVRKQARPDVGVLGSSALHPSDRNIHQQLQLLLELALRRARADEAPPVLLISLDELSERVSELGEIPSERLWEKGGFKNLPQRQRVVRRVVTHRSVRYCSADDRAMV